MNQGLTEAGCDEAGRGPLAGPVFAAAVILPEDFRHPMLDDSKKMTEKARNLLRPVIEKEAVAFAVEAVSAEEIDFHALPEQFVLKCNHDSGGVIICRDKKEFDIQGAKAELNKHLRHNYYYSGREWPYKDVKPCIIAEKYMEDESGELRDYKIFCFDGRARFFFIASDRSSEKEETKFDFFDTEGKHMPFTNGHPNAPEQPPCPKRLGDMCRLA